MGLSSKKTKTKQTPIVMEPLNTDLGGLESRITGFANTDPHQFVAPASPLQTQAFTQGQQLGGWRPYAHDAASLAHDYSARPATNVQMTGYNAPRLGAAPVATAAGLGGPTAAQAYQLGGPDLAPFRSIFDDGGIQKFIDPGIESYVRNTMADYDADTGAQRAAIRAEAARNRAFGGSRFGVEEGQFEADAGRKRALTESELRAQAYAQGLNAAMAEAQRRQGLDMADMDAGNQFRTLQGQFGQQTNMFNAQTANDFAKARADYQQQVNMFNPELASRYAFTQAGIDADAARYGAEAANQGTMKNADLQEQQYLRMLQAAGLLGELGTQYAGNERSDLGLLADLGGTQRGIESEYLNAVPTQLQLASNLYGGLYPAYIGSKSVSKESGLGSVLGGLAQTIGSGLMGGTKPWIFSDRRLKDHIARIGNHGALGLYRFNYKGDDQDRIGVMADEVAIHAPEALGPSIGGYATVDYGKLGLAHLA